MEDDPQRRKPDITRAKEKLHWQPVVWSNYCGRFQSEKVDHCHVDQVPVREGIRRTIEYFQKELEAETKTVTEL